MNQPSVLRQKSPHKVEVSEGSKDAHRRLASERSATPPPTPITLAEPWTSAPSPHTHAPSAQISQAPADTSEAWHGDDAMAERLAQLRKNNQRLAQRLRTTTLTGPHEDANE
jgi:hypothetical protein